MTVYQWNPIVSYLRLLFIIAGVVLCVENQIIAAIIDFLLFAALYFIYIKVNHDLILKMSNKNNLVRVTGHKYSFANPMTIHVRK